MAPKRPSIAIVVYAGRNIKEYLDWGKAAVTAMLLPCPVCGARLVGNGWRERIAKRESQGFDPHPAWILVRELVCPACEAAERRPYHFRVLPSLLYPFKHFLQRVRLSVFDRALQRGERPVAIEAATRVDRWLVQIWINRADLVLPPALPELAADLLRFGGRLPAVARDAVPWERWWALGLALRTAMAAVDPALAEVQGSVLEWVTVVGARRQRWWALAP
jgi:hypothetical protein